MDGDEDDDGPANVSFAGKITILLSDAWGSQLPVARDRVRLLRTRLEFRAFASAIAGSRFDRKYRESKQEASFFS